MIQENPHEFWDLRPDHPINDDGNPLDEVIGDYHILFTTMTHPESGELRPDYQVHNDEHSCVAHMHEHVHAKLLCATLSSVMRGYLVGTRADWLASGILREGQHLL